LAVRLTGAERRGQILRTSMRLFAERGFSATRTRDLARAAGVSEALVFKLFPDKESLYRAILEQKIEQAEAALPLAEIEGSDEPPRRFFERLAEVMLQRTEDDPTFLRLLLFSALEGHPLAAEFDAARAVKLRRAIASYVKRQARAGTIAKCDAEFAARAFLALVFSFVQSRTIFREPGCRRIPRDRLVRGLVSTFLGGLDRA